MNTKTMKSYSGIRKRLGTRGAIAYLRDYHQQRINPEGTWSDAISTLESYGADEREIAQHARFMDECGSDLQKYAWRFPATRKEQQR